MTVAVLLIVLLLQIFSSSTTNWQRGEVRTDAFREARAALQVMGRDLSQTIQPFATPAPTTATSSATPAPATTAPLPLLVLQRSTESVPPTAAFEEAYCLTAIPNNGGSSDVCAVGYYCQWDSNKHAFVLMRQFSNSDATFANIARATAGSHPPLLTFLNLFSRAAGAGTTTTDLASYIWDLEVRIDTSLKAMVVDPPVPPAASSQPAPTRYYGTDPPYPDHLPPFVEIRFKAMSTGAAQALENNGAITQATWQDPTSALYQKFILPSAQQFSVRLPMLNFDASAAAAVPTPSPAP